MTSLIDVSQMRFRHPWRRYQARLLDEMAQHLADEKLHFVAAPGAGKTVLGLEIIRRLNRKTLILAPSLLVRDQWISRLVTDFMGGERPDWISTDLTSDALVRVSTYQDAHMNRAQLLPRFDLLCLDEAHHLRRSWWKTLTRFVQVNQPVTLSLTATPPYDVEASEWRNYLSLCGPVDAEISVPELVQSGDLCPHQDLVYLAPTADGEAYQDNLDTERALFHDLASNPALIAALRTDPWIVEPERHTHAILENPARFSAMLIYLRHNAVVVPVYAKRVLQVNDVDWPALDWNWLATLLQEWPLDQAPPDVMHRLRASGGLRNDRLILPPPVFAERLSLLKNDQAKLAAMQEIFEIELAAKGPDLRMAILLDRIGKTNLDAPSAAPEFNTLGVFRYLLERTHSAPLAVLTGQVAILPTGLCQGFETRPVSGAMGYCLVAGAQISQAVARVNRAFANGDVQVIIGTQAFLGQGWDAPALNALVLGTRLKSFVAVNQLRGRALRRDPQRPNKTSHIWHLAVVPHRAAEGEDVDLLKRRFECFVRLDRDAGAIQSDFHLASTVAVQNQAAAKRAASGAALAGEWQAALAGANHRIGGFEAKLATRTTLPWRQKRQALPIPALSFWGRVSHALGRAPSLSETRRVITRIAKLVIASLSELGDLPPVSADLAPIVMWDGQSWQIGLNTRCKLDEAIFHEVFQQVFDPISGPRYVISLKTGLIQANYQYFAVPDRFGSNKDRAALFWRNWQGYVGRGRLVYTRTVAGRAVLQAARLSSSDRNTKTTTRWM